jgi:hypothetical protein
MAVVRTRAASAGLDPHLVPELRVEVAQGLLEEEDAGVADDGASQRHSLTLSARQLARLTVQKALDLEQARHLRHARLALGPRHPAHPQVIADVVTRREVRKDRVVLEDHGDVPMLGRHLRHPLGVKVDVSPRRHLEPRDHPERGGLAAAAGADQRHELALANLEREVLYRHGFPEETAEDLADALERHRRHCPTPT